MYRITAKIKTTRKKALRKQEGHDVLVIGVVANLMSVSAERNSLVVIVDDIVFLLSCRSLKQ